MLQLLIATLALGSVETASQPLLDTTGRWQVIDHPLHSGFGSDGYTNLRITVHSPRHVYLYAVEDSARFFSSDKGATWSRHEGFVPSIVKYFPGGVGISTKGEITRDDGVTWEQLRYDSGDTAFTGYLQPWVFAPGSPRNMAMRLPFAQIYFDSAQGRMSYYTLTRILYTTDGGESWRKLDTVIDNGDSLAYRRFEVHMASPFDDLPPLQGEPRRTINWEQWHMMPDSTTLFLRATVSNMLPPSNSKDYLVRIDLATGETTWHLSPRFVTAHTRDVLTSDVKLNDGSAALLRTVDGGATWDTISVPATLNLSRLRVLSPTHMVGPYAKSFDGGRTWESIIHPWDGSMNDEPNFAVIDSATYLMTNGYSLVARSTDAGETWTRNHAWGAPRSIAASRGRVLIGWSYRALTRSTDRGATWSDIGVTEGDGLPGNVSSVVTLGFPDTAAAPDLVVGLAIFKGDDGRKYAGLIRSDDGGLTWKEGAGIGSEFVLEALLGMSRTRFHFVPATGGGRAWIISGRFAPIVSLDSGVTWQQRDSRALDRLAMEDAEHGVGFSADVDAIFVTEDGWRTSRQVYPIDFGHKVLEMDALGGGRYRALLTTGEIRSTDGGSTWTRSFSTGNDPRAIDPVVHRLDSNRLYITAASQILYSPDGGRTYQSYPTGHGNYDTRHVAAGDGHYLYVATVENFIARWRLGDEPSSGVRADREETGAGIVVMVSPDKDAALIRYEITHSAPVEVALYDMLGNRVREGRGGVQEPGPHTERLDLSGLPSGRYFARVRIGAGMQSVPLQIAR